MKNPDATARKTAVASFLIGTLFFMLLLIAPHDLLLVFATIAYIAAAALVNAFFVILSVARLFTSSDKKTTVITLAIVTANIPLVIIYFAILRAIQGPLINMD